MDEPFWHIIANPAARGGAMQKDWPTIEQTLQKLGFSYNVQFTQRRGHAAELVENAILKGGRYILGIGGDGTNHELVNGIFSQQFAPPSELTYALLPYGTGNDWARQYGISHNIEERLKRLRTPETVWQDIGLARYAHNGEKATRYFVNVAGMAYDGFIGKKLMERPAKNKLEYLLYVAKYLWEYKLTKV